VKPTAALDAEGGSASAEAAASKPPAGQEPRRSPAALAHKLHGYFLTLTVVFREHKHRLRTEAAAWPKFSFTTDWLEAVTAQTVPWAHAWKKGSLPCP